MSTVIETGKTVEEALEKALIALGRSKDEVDYEVLEQPSRGFFGLFGGHLARLRVTEKQAAPDASAFAAPAAAASGAAAHENAQRPKARRPKTPGILFRDDHGDGDGGRSHGTHDPGLPCPFSNPRTTIFNLLS